MALEDKIKRLIEGVEDQAEELSEEEAGASNAKITAGKGRKLEDRKNNGEPSTDEPNNKKNHVDRNPSGAVKEHIDALSDGEDLSEDFKAKAATILEAAIHEGVQVELARLAEENELMLNEAVDAVREELVEQIDGFLNVVVEQWLSDNELALENGVKNEVLENFVDGLKRLFKENYIEVPEEKLDILDEQAAKIEELANTLDEATNVIGALENQVVDLTMTRIKESVGVSLTDTEFEKFVGLCEGIEFRSVDTYEEKLKTLKESYFPKNRRDTVIAESDTPVINNLTEGSMAQYVSALSGPLSFKR